MSLLVCNRTDAAARLEWSLSLPAGSVKVKVQDGWVTLTGTVDWQLQRHDAADVVLDLQGVTGLSNQIAIQPAASVGEKAQTESALNRRGAAAAKSVLLEVKPILQAWSPANGA